MLTVGAAQSRGKACRALVALLFAFLALTPGRARSEAPTTILSADAIGRYGPPGAMLSLGATWCWPREDGPSTLEQGRHTQLGVSLGVNPAYSQASAFVEWIPTAPLQLRLQYDAYGFFGANGALLRFPSSGSGFGDAEIAALSGHETGGIGHRLAFSPVLRAKLGRVLLRNQTDLNLYWLSRSAGWYHESEYDTLLAKADWLVSNRTAALLEVWRGEQEAILLVGPMYDVTRAGAGGISRQRAGAAAWWATPAAHWLGLDGLRFYALAGVNLADRNRRGQPFAILGMGGDLEVRPAHR
jgi:hypothetical protein